MTVAGRRLRPVAADPRAGGRPAARARRVPAGGRQPPPSCASRTGSPATSRTPPRSSTGSTTPSAGCCRMGDEPVDADQRRPAACCAPRPARCSPTASTCSASPRPSGCERRAHAHEAGWAHAAGAAARARTGCASPSDPNALVPARSGRGTAPQGRRRPERRRRAAARPGRASTARRRTSSTRPTSAARARRLPRRLRATCRRLLRRQGVPLHDGRPLDRRGGALPRRLLRRRAGRRRCGPASRPERIGFHGNNKTARRARARRRARASAGSSSTPSTRSSGSPTSPPSSAATARVMVRVTAGVEAHTHEYIATAHEDQKFGFSITSGDALEAVRRVHAAPGLELLGLHSHIGSQIFDTSGFEVAARRVLALHARVLRGARASRCPSSTSAAASASPTRPRTTRPTPRSWPPRCTKIVRARVPRPRHRAARACRSSPGRAIVGPSMCTVYEVGTVKAVELDGGAVPHLRLRRRRDERQHPHRAVRRRLLRARSPPAPPTRPPVLARVVGKHCEAGDIVVKDEFLPGDVAPGDLRRRARAPAPTAGRWLSNYNHALRPPVVAVRDGKTGSSCCAARRWTTCWRPMWVLI